MSLVVGTTRTPYARQTAASCARELRVQPVHGPRTVEPPLRERVADAGRRVARLVDADDRRAPAAAPPAAARRTEASWRPSIGHDDLHCESRNVSSTGRPRSDASETSAPRWSRSAKFGAGRVARAPRPPGRGARAARAAASRRAQLCSVDAAATPRERTADAAPAATAQRARTASAERALRSLDLPAPRAGRPATEQQRPVDADRR